MQTTLTIDDDVLAAVETLAVERHQTVGEVISSLTRQALPVHKANADSVFEMRDGLPSLPLINRSHRITFEAVEHLKDELVG